MPSKAPTTLEELDAIVGIKPAAPMKIGGAAGRPAPGKITSGKMKVPAEPSPIEDDMPEIEALRERFEHAGTKYGIPAEILAGIASRESRVGKHLNSAGYDEEKKAYGIMQVDERFHKRRGKKPDSQEHINQAAEILAKNKKQIDEDKRFAKWSDEQRMRAAVAAYNFGVGNVKTWKDLDVGTTGNDYSKDVMERARVYRERMLSAGK